jgi:class 3 adenylate cyclase
MPVHRIAGAVHAFGSEVLEFIGDGVLAIFPVAGSASAARDAPCAPSPPRLGMAHLDATRRQRVYRPCPSASLHLGEIQWNNISAADQLISAIGPAVNLVSRLEGLCQPLDKTVLVSTSPPNRRAADPARNTGVARHRPLRRLHRADT